MEKYKETCNVKSPYNKSLAGAFQVLLEEATKYKLGKITVQDC